MMRNLSKSAVTAGLLLLSTTFPSEAQQVQPVPPQATAQPAAGGVPLAPFTLTPQEQASLDQLLLAWEKQSNGTKRLEAKFRRWHFDLLAAPAGVHATWAEGVIKYGSPDKGLFRVDQLKFFNGIVEGKPTYTENAGQFGEYWVCDGVKLQEFDRSKKECKIQQLPAELRGKEIFESPLPFVFNLNAAKIKERYWIKQLETNPGIVAIEAHPKFQNDRAQYKFVRIVISAETFLPQALILFGPNFDPETSPAYDHYEFMELERNTLAQSLANWGGVFLNERPPSDWRVIEDVYRPDTQPQLAQPGVGSTIR